MNVPAELKFTQEHEWVKLEGKIALVGLDSAEYSKLVEDETVTKKKAMRSKRA